MSKQQEKIVLTLASKNEDHNINDINNNKKGIVEDGLDFILSHLEEPVIFPRTIMTKKIAYQRIVYSKERAIEHFVESDFIDCRINAYPYLTKYKDVPRYKPDFIFIDLDRKSFKTKKGFELALYNTLKNIKQKLPNGYPTVLFTGGGYHIYQPVYCPTALENVTEFQDFDRPSEQFLRFARDNLSNNKADKQNNPSFRSCLLRISGSINSKYGNKVSIVKKWNGIRSPITREFIEDYRIHLIQKKIDEDEQRHKMLLKLKGQNNNNTNNKNYYEWIDKKILANPFEDYRKIIVNLILAPYLVIVKKLSFEESFQIIDEWLKKCALIKKLDFDPKSLINTALATAYKKQIPPMSIKTMKNNYKDLFFLIEQKERKREGRKRGGIE
jgi:hypothetical protein